MYEQNIKEVLIKIILTLENDHHGCKQEACNIAKSALGIDFQHNDLREMMNSISEHDIQRIVALLGD
ncbi:hypothetical protein OAG1_07040 [Agarivorans sp. OAG1]|uniref:hypothetical protein n=1 Tax=unclassified Agarivorans TaxID=2636026 RepID=UPI002B317BA7|nr:hypothetical protein OAG1_07040 [Agarivorans sp. OAG1]